MLRTPDERFAALPGFRGAAVRGLGGLRVAVERPARCARIVAMDTGLFTGASA